jgi:hypothetical protein
MKFQKRWKHLVYNQFKTVDYKLSDCQISLHLNPFLGQMKEVEKVTFSNTLFLDSKDFIIKKSRDEYLRKLMKHIRVNKLIFFG